jgi:phage-related protein
MATEQRIGAAFIEVISKGLSKVQTDLNGLKKSLVGSVDANKDLNKETGKTADVAKTATEAFKKFTTQVEKIGNAAKYGFAIATASILGFIRAADPYSFSRFAGNLAALSVQIGSIFLPIIDKLNKGLEGLLGWFRNLSDKQKDNILHWVEIGVAVLGFLMLIPKMIALFNMASAAMAFFGVTTGVATGGITTVLGIIAALIPAVIGLGAVMGGAGEEASIFGSILAAFKPIIDPVMNAFNQFTSKLLPLFSRFGEVVAKVWQSLGGIFGAVSQIIQAEVGAFAGIFEAVLPVVMEYVKSFAGVLNNLADVVAPVFGLMTRVLKVVADAYTSGFKTIGAVVGAVMPVIEALMEVFGAVAEAVTSLLAPAFEILSVPFQIVISLVEDLVGALEPMVPAIVRMANAIKDVMVPMFKTLKDTLKSMIDFVYDALDRIIDTINMVIRTANKIPGIKIAEVSHATRPHISTDEKKDKDAGKKEDTGRHTPKATGQVQIGGLVDAYKKAQESVRAETPEERARREQVELQKKSLGEQEETNDWLKKLLGKNGSAIGP